MEGGNFFEKFVSLTKENKTMERSSYHDSSWDDAWIRVSEGLLKRKLGVDQLLSKLMKIERGINSFSYKVHAK